MGGFETRPYRGSLGLLCPITSAVSSYWWYFGIIVLARAFFALSCCRGGFQTRPQGDASYGDTGIIVLARGFFAFSYLVGGYITRPYRGSFNVGVVMPNHVHGIVVLVVFWDYHIGTGIFCIFVFGGRV